MKLNLACGTDYREGYVNVDVPEVIESGHRVDHVHNLDAYPWPWKNVDHILMRHYLEHKDADEMVDTLRECWRVLKPGGTLEIIVPHALGFMAHSLGHKTYYNFWTFFQLQFRHHWLGMDFYFEQVSYRVKIASRRLWLGPLDWFASRFPRAWETLGVLPPMEITWVGGKPC